jgi:hypothetical protein
MENFEARTLAGLGEYRAAAGNYLDVHGWFLTPGAAKMLFSQLPLLGYTNLKLERMYPSRRNHNEFWFVLRKETG